MKFHVTLIHTPENCPLAHAGAGLISDWHARAEEVGITLIFVLVDQLAHTNFCVVETDDITKLQEFFRPFLGLARADVRPVRDILHPA